MGPGHLELTAEEQEFLHDELRFQLGGARKTDVEEIERLLPCIDARDIPPECVPILERLLEFELASGTLRGRRGDDGERIAIHVYGRTPRGRGLIEHMQNVNSDLSTLAGARILDSRCVVPKFGELSVLLTTDRAEVMMTFTGAGLTVNRLELGNAAEAAASGGSTSTPRAARGGRGRGRARGSKRALPRRKSRRSGRR
ncbi:MAG TPA: hypothetical protein VI893_00100 [Thermoplasmata archaeon]|nr:hypothetical protein [Thermoplasmata archaeon]